MSFGRLYNSENCWDPHKKLAQKFAQLERRVESHNDHIHSLFEDIRPLMEPPASRIRRIGFKTRESEQ
jgi:hypothetical protein